MKKKYQHNRIFTLNNPLSPRICPELATEIGLNESILLLQYEFWLATESEERDGYTWIRRTVREVRQDFCFWSTGTVNNIIQSLVKTGYLIEGKYDVGPGKNGRWLRFDFERLATLKSIQVICSDSEQPLSKKSAYLSNSRTTVFNINKEEEISTRARGKGYKTEPKPIEEKTLYPPADFQITELLYLWLAEMCLPFSDDELRTATQAWHESRGAEPYTKGRTLVMWENDWKKFIRAYWEIRQRKNGNGYHDAKPVQRVQTIRERMGLDG